MKMTLTEAMKRIAELEAKLATLTAPPPSKTGANDWRAPNTLSKDDALTDTREWRNSSWRNVLTEKDGGRGTPPGPWERELLTLCHARSVSVPRIGYCPCKGVRGMREVACKKALEVLTLTVAPVKRAPREVEDM